MWFEFRVVSRVRQETFEEGRRLFQPIPSEYKNEDNGPNTLKKNKKIKLNVTN